MKYAVCSKDGYKVYRFIDEVPFECVGTSGYNENVRDELNYQPRFEGLIGPMWGGDDCLLYESKDVYYSMD